MKSLENHRKAALIVAGCSWVLSACGGGKSTPMLDDGGVIPTGDGGLPDATASDFDPSVTYPGEGDACRLSMECGDRQICVDDACVRHERIDPSEVRLGEWRLASEEASRALELGVDPGRNDATVVLPGNRSPIVVSTTELENGCRLTRIDGEWKTVHLDGVECLSGESTDDGGLLVGGFRRSDGHPLLVRLSPELREIERVDLDSELIASAFTPALERRIGGVTGVLVDGPDVLVSVGIFSHDERIEHDETVVLRVAANGDQTVELERVPGGRGWLVRDARGISVLTTEWQWSDESSPTPDHLGTEFRYLRSPIDGSEAVEEYLGSAETAWIYRETRDSWQIVLYELSAPDCVIRSLSDAGVRVITLRDDSAVRRGCVESPSERGAYQAPNQGRSSPIPNWLFGRLAREWTVLAPYADDGDDPRFGLEAQSTTERVYFEEAEGADFTQILGSASVFSRFGMTVEALRSPVVRRHAAFERKLERL